MAKRVHIINLGGREAKPFRGTIKHSKFKRKIYCPKVHATIDNSIISNGHIGSKILIGMTFDTPIL